MPIVLPRLVAFSGAGALALSGLMSQGCKRREAPPPTPPSASPSAAPAPEEVSRCRKGAELSLASDAPRPAPPADDAEADEEDDALLPFGVAIGDAVPTAFGFAAAGLRGAGQAFVALVSERGARRVELGELHGDAETPSIASHGDSVLVALRTTDASGFTIKLGRVDERDGSQVEWGYELTKLGRAITSVELAAQGGRGVLVYQTEVKGAPRLMLGTFEVAKLSTAFEAKPLELKDVEMPRLISRAGGYWLTWVRSLPEEAKKKATPAVEAGASRDPEERELLDPGLRVVEVTKLDEQGKPVGSALRVGEPRRQILLYDVAPLTTGSLLVATRSESAAPGAEGGAILLSEVGPDGGIREGRLDDDEIGAGAPTLLPDGDAKRPGPWLAVSAPNDMTRVGLVEGARTRLQTDPLLGRAELLAVAKGRFLAQRARGNAVVLEVLDCAWSTEAPLEKK
jgi:hypothetical protein